MALEEDVVIAKPTIIRFLPGFALTVTIAALALLGGANTPPALSAVLLALLVGLVITNVRPLPTSMKPGIDLSAKRVLRVGVALLGARLTLGDVVAIGGPSLLVVLATMTTAFITVAFAGRLAGISPRLGILLGTGTAVCGNSAIVAASPIIGAKDREVSYAVATITIFGTIALVLFPLIGRAVAMPDAVFGTWAGLAINDTSQVVAAGAAYSERALEHATVVKLVRNAIMGPILIGLAIWAGRQRTKATVADGRGPDPDSEHSALSSIGLLKTARSAVPGFVIAFIVLAALRSIGVISVEVADAMSTASKIAITIAIAGVGLKTRVAELTSVGPRPVLVGLAAATALAIVALPLAYLVAG